MAEHATKPYPVVKCSEEEYHANRAIGIQRTAIDMTMAIAVDAVMTKHAQTLCAIQELGDKMWAILKQKYRLDATKDYGIRMIDGKPFICEIPRGEPRPQ